MTELVTVSLPKYFWEANPIGTVDTVFAKKVRIKLDADELTRLYDTATKVSEGKDGMASSARSARETLDKIPRSLLPKDSNIEAPKKKRKKPKGTFADRLRRWDWWKKERHQGNYTCSNCGTFKFCAGPSYETMVCRECHLPEEDNGPDPIKATPKRKVRRKR